MPRKMEGFQVTRVVSSLLSSVAIAACEVQRVNWPARTRNEHESVLVNCGIDAETVNMGLLSAARLRSASLDRGCIHHGRNGAAALHVHCRRHWGPRERRH